jgi:hypothetical protein
MTHRNRGKPASDSEFRCQGIRKCGLRCERWALKSKKYCQFHGGRKRGYEKDWLVRVAGFYRRSLTKALEDAVQESLAQKPDDVLNLFQELALTREAAQLSVRMYGAALETNKQESILIAAELMAMHLQKVAEMCKAAAALHTEQREKFSVHDLNYIVEQIIRISYDTFKEHELVNHFALRLRREIQISKAQATTITPDQEVLEMDKDTTG